MKLISYLFFDGQCEAAFAFYASCLRGKLEMLLRAHEAPGHEAMPAALRDRVMHARLAVGDQVLMGSDWISDTPFKPAQGFYVSLQVGSVAEAQRIFGALSEGGTVHMALDKTFYAVAFGMLVDRFGTPWMVNCPTDG